MWGPALLAAWLALGQPLGARGQFGDSLKRCPLYPQHQAFREPQVTENGDVTLSVETITLCSPVTGRFWKSRAYACPSCGSPGSSLPGPTIRTKPGAELYITLENKLEPPNPTPQEVTKHQEMGLLEGHANDLKKYKNAHVHSLGYLNATSFHPHGLHVSPEAKEKRDGITYLSDTIFTEVLPGGAPNKYLFKLRSDHMGGTHWYHPHHHHSTAVQAGGGLHGALIVEDPEGSVPDEVKNMKEILSVISLVDLRGVQSNSLSGMGLLEEQGEGGLWKDLEGPTMGQYVKEDRVFALVNGMWRPKLSIDAGRWYRFRFIFAAVQMFIEAATDSNSGMDCEMQLLAKDGVWLHVAPRAISRIYLASGNRADVALKCECKYSRTCDGGLYATDVNPRLGNLEERQKEIEANLHPMNGLNSDRLIQELIRFDVGVPSWGQPQPALQFFSVKRPCYLVDLRNVDVPVANWGRLDFWSPEDAPDAGWKVTWSDWYSKFKGAQMNNMSAPALFDLKVGNVYQFLVRGPTAKKGGIAKHPLHLHTIPYQIVSLVTMDPYFLVGDWHDTLLHTAGQAVVRLQTDTYVGRYVVHCHVLSHEDFGMMSYFNVGGEDGTVWPGAEQADPSCYRPGGQPGWRWVGEAERKADQTLPAMPHWIKGPMGYDCHRACIPFGGCNGLGWPKSDMEFSEITTSTRSVCTPTYYSNPSEEASYNPSYMFGGVCSWKFKSYFTSETVDEGQYRCGKQPPYNVARYCPCNKVPGAPAQMFV